MKLKNYINLGSAAAVAFAFALSSCKKADTPVEEGKEDKTPPVGDAADPPTGDGQQQNQRQCKYDGQHQSRPGRLHLRLTSMQRVLAMVDQSSPHPGAKREQQRHGRDP